MAVVSVDNPLCVDDQTPGVCGPLQVTVRELTTLPDVSAALAWVSGNNCCLWVDPSLVFIGVGEAHRMTTSGVGAGRTASAQWMRIAHNAEVNIRGTAPTTFSAPVAMGSFGFFPDTPGSLIIPKQVIALQISHGVTVGAWEVVQGWTRKRESPDIDEVSQQVASAPTFDKTPSWADGDMRVEEYSLSVDQWRQAVGDVIDLMHRGVAQKVVMARSERVSVSTPISVPELANRLHKAYPTCWTFAVDGLVGASPEMLADVVMGQLHCLVLAGTAAPDEGEQLMTSTKDREEHHLAVKSAAEVLTRMCESVDIPDEPDVLVLPNVSHLATHIHADTGGSTALDIADSLHPTAAVCGTPTPVARQIIAEHESLQRGRYAGPVGWIDAEGDGQWAIALRCGQLIGDPGDYRAIDVIAGGGIMPDSDPDVEVVETKRKMQPMLNALGVS